MNNPFPVNLQTSAEVRQQGWQAESRDADGHLISCHAPIEADDQGIAEWIVECTSRGETVTFWPTNGDQPPPPSTHVALPETNQLTAEIHGEGHAADEGDPVVDCHRDASQKVSSEGNIAGEQLLSKMPHGHAAWKAEAFDKILAARKKHVDAVAAYNNRLTIVRSERERGNHSMRLDEEYEAMSEAHSKWHRTCQGLADAALATTEGSTDA